MSEEFYKFLLTIQRIGNRAVRKAQEENRRLGLPNVYVKKHKIYYELPDGTITTTNPLLES